MSGVMGSMRYFAGGLMATAGLLAAAPLPKAECSNRDKVGPVVPLPPSPPLRWVVDPFLAAPSLLCYVSSSASPLCRPWGHAHLLTACAACACAGNRDADAQDQATEVSIPLESVLCSIRTPCLETLILHVILVVALGGVGEGGCRGGLAQTGWDERRQGRGMGIKGERERGGEGNGRKNMHSANFCSVLLSSAGSRCPHTQTLPATPQEAVRERVHRPHARTPDLLQVVQLPA